MKRILIVISTEFVSYGGLTTVMLNYYRHMNKEDLQIDFASTNENIDQELIRELHKYNSNYYYLGSRKKNPFIYYRNLRKLLKEKKYDLIHINATSATASIELCAAKQEGISKRIVHIHSSQPDHKILNELLKPIIKILTTDCLAVSPESGKMLFAGKDFEVLKNAIDVEHYAYNENKRKGCRKSLGISESSFVIGNVGKMTEGKNHKFLIELLPYILQHEKNAMLLFVGDGDKRKELERLSEEKGIKEKCIFIGMQMDTSPFLSAMDVFAFPSLHEGLSLALIEAQASGLDCYFTSTLSKTGILAKNCHGLDLNNKNKWIMSITNRDGKDRLKSSTEAIKIISDKGFNIRLEANNLREIYMSKNVESSYGE